MGKRIAMITGASGGIGKEFTRTLLAENVDEIWAIARNQENLEKLKAEFGDKVIPISKDLSKTESLYAIKELLEQERPVIAYLVNNAGVAKMGSYQDFSVQEIETTIQLNCIALVALCTICIPYMAKGSMIFNLSSASSFQPLPYLNLYASTKVLERSYSRALNVELKGTGISTIAVCPSWVDTDLLKGEINDHVIKLRGIVSPQQVVAKAIKDAKKGKDISVCSLYVKWLHLLAKLFPERMSMQYWLKQIKW